jgi:serine/threonine-protein kinase
MTGDRHHSDRWEEIEKLFHTVVELEPDDRSRYLAEHCDDTTILFEVQRLLQHDREDNGFLDASAWHPRLTELAHEFVRDDDPMAQPGVRIGRYQLLEPIAAGGMGTVWRAERVDGQFAHHVAIKLIKRGMDTDDILHRFRNERQLLASFAHPNIARLLDGGATEDGRPYLVMEYIDGVPIDQYCNDHKLSVRDRLALVQRVCTAVHEAHKSLIVHRDLKPSNLLVTPEGEPKLLDFGIAKVLGQVEAVQPVLTATRLRLLTPRYASPEQVRGEMVTTASDVYSLGVILYELLTGCRPYNVQMDSRQELERAVLEREPTRPSLVVNRTPDDPAGNGAPRTRYGLAEISPRRLSRLLKGDLDTIVLTALRKEPERRYSSAEELASDIARYLQNDPITARPDTWRYRSSKFVRRNRGPLAALSVILVVIVGAAVVASIGWIRALGNERQAQESLIELVREGLRRSTDEEIAARAEAAGLKLDLQREGDERRFLIDFSTGDQIPKLAAFSEQIFLWLEEEREEAEAAREVAERIVVFLNDDLLATANPSISPAGELTMREALDRAAASVESRFADKPRIEAPIRETIGKTYRSLGLPKQAIPHLARAAELYEALDGPEHSNARDATRAWADALCLDGQFPECLKLCRNVLELDIEADGRESASAMASRHLILRSGGVEAFEPRVAELQELIAWNTANLGEAHAESLAVMHTLANEYIFLHQFSDAEPIIDRIWTATRATYGESHPETLWAMLGKGILSNRLGDTEAAVEVLQRAVELYRQSKREDATNLGITLVHLGNLLDTLERWQESEAAYLEAYDILTRSLGEDNGWTSGIVPFLINVYERTGREDQAVIWREKLPEPERE